MAFVKNSSGSSRSLSVSAGSNSEKRRSRTLAKQQQMSESIASISGVILENAQESVSAIEQLKSSMEQIATAAEENSGASDEALTNVRTISKNIGRMSNSIDSVITSTLTTGESITSSVELVNQTVHRMGDAVEVAKASSTKSEELKVSSQNIGEAVAFIAKIADQTNLLALNAAIEASRAKEHGKGFAVVADETRSLAGESEKNAEFISELVTKIQGSIDTIIKNIVVTNGTISETGEKGTSLSQQLEELTKIAVYSVEAARNINSYTSKLSENTQRINEGSKKITESSASIASAVERTLNSIEIQSEALTQTEDDIKELSRLSEELKYSTDSVKSAEDIATSADSISGSVEDIQGSLSEVTGALNEIESASHTTNQNTLKNKDNIEEALTVSQDIDALITIARRNFDILKVSFSKVKAVLVEIKGDFIDSVTEGRDAENELQVIVKDTRNVEKTVRNISNSIIQLNMLAISGSIEAARAGEFGKGFAVVSSDIRSLAKDSESNTEKIYDIIESMNGEINTVQTDWSNLLSGQEDERGSIDQLIVDIDRISEQLIDLLDRYQGLKTNNDQNKEGLNQVLTGTVEIQKAIELSATNAMESRKASELIIETVSHIGEGVEELAVMADELQQG
jgi:methyl-accepting chemotaxis protein